MPDRFKFCPCCGIQYSLLGRNNPSFWILHCPWNRHFAAPALHRGSRHEVSLRESTHGVETHAVVTLNLPGDAGIFPFWPMRGEWTKSVSNLVDFRMGWLLLSRPWYSYPLTYWTPCCRRPCLRETLAVQVGRLIDVSPKIFIHFVGRLLLFLKHSSIQSNCLSSLLLKSPNAFVMRSTEIRSAGAPDSFWGVVGPMPSDDPSYLSVLGLAPRHQVSQLVSPKTW